MRLIGMMWRILRVEFFHLRLNMAYVLLLTIIPSLVILFLRPSFVNCFLIEFVPLMISLVFLLSLPRFFNIHILGEVMEIFRVSMSKPGIARQDTSFFENEFSSWYKEMMISIIFLQTGIFLLLPVYVNYTIGGFTALIILMFLCIIAFIVARDDVIKNGGSNWFVETVKTVIVLMAIVIFIGWIVNVVPQVGFYANYLGADKFKIVPTSVAMKANEITALRDKQRKNQTEAQLREAYEWQKAHPGAKLPPKYENIVEEAGNIISSDDEPAQIVASSKSMSENLDERTAQRRSYVYGN